MGLVLPIKIVFTSLRNDRPSEWALRIGSAQKPLVRPPENTGSVVHFGANIDLRLYT